MIELDLLYRLSCSGSWLAESAGAGFVAGPALIALAFHCAHDRVGPVLRTRAASLRPSPLGQKPKPVSPTGVVSKHPQGTFIAPKKKMTWTYKTAHSRHVTHVG
jgi:hypothetical protein